MPTEGKYLPEPGSSLVPDWNQNTGPLTSIRPGCQWPQLHVAPRPRCSKHQSRNGALQPWWLPRATPGSSKEDQNSDLLPGLRPVVAIWKTRTTAFRHILASHFPPKWWHLMGPRVSVHLVPLGMGISYRSLSTSSGVCFSTLMSLILTKNLNSTCLDLAALR